VSLPERPHLLPVDNDRSDQLGVLEHGHEQNGPNVTQLYAGHRIRIAIEIALLRREVGDMNGLFRLHHAAKVPTAAAQRRALTFLDQCWRRIVRGGKVEHLPIAQILFPKVASQICVAFVSIVLNTVSSSPGEFAMRRKTSSLATCRSKASFTSAAVLVRES